jgi:hypothetical protein
MYVGSVEGRWVSPPHIVDISQIINMSIRKFAGRGNANARIRIAADRRWL